MSRIVLTGAGGLLGSAFKGALREFSVTTLGRDHLDADAPGDLSSLIRSADPELLINCAADTDVERAERDASMNLKVNAQLPAVIAEICKRYDIKLVHFSSTGCYGNWKSTPYVDDDELRPPTAHHRAKAMGEDAVRNSGCRYLILRTGWLFGGGPEQPKNFVWKRLLESRSSKELFSDASQRGCPTHVVDLVKQVLLMARTGLDGTFNVTSQGSASRYEYVSAIVAASGVPCVVKPGPPFARLARVSANETARNARLQSLGLDCMPGWQDSIRSYVSDLLTSPAWLALDRVRTDHRSECGEA